MVGGWWQDEGLDQRNRIAQSLGLLLPAGFLRPR
jgi:hypothetical protein